MPNQFYQVRNLYSDQTFGGFELRAGKKARVRIEVEKTDSSRYGGVARMLEADECVVAQGEGETPEAAIGAVIAELRSYFNFVARIGGKDGT
jgi:hypothetical protein